MPTPSPNSRKSRQKRSLSSISCSSHPSSDDDRPHKKLALSLNRLSLSGSPARDNEKDIPMKQRKSYEKDEFTTVIESLSTSTDEEEEVFEVESDAPFPRDEAHVTILSEIEKRLTRFPLKMVTPSVVADTALVLYRSPESMGLPRLERQRVEDEKVEMRRRILERRRGVTEVLPTEVEGEDGYEADVDDWEDTPRNSPLVNGIHDNGELDDNDDDDGEMMDLD
jgi:hypothetical protein